MRNDHQDAENISACLPTKRLTNPPTYSTRLMTATAVRTGTYIISVKLKSTLAALCYIFVTSSCFGTRVCKTTKPLEGSRRGRYSAKAWWSNRVIVSHIISALCRPRRWVTSVLYVKARATLHDRASVSRRYILVPPFRRRSQSTCVCLPR